VRYAIVGLIGAKKCIRKARFATRGRESACVHRCRQVLAYARRRSLRAAAVRACERAQSRAKTSGGMHEGTHPGSPKKNAKIRALFFQLPALVSRQKKNAVKLGADISSSSLTFA
jgi:hypothetical protein